MPRRIYMSLVCFCLLIIIFFTLAFSQEQALFVKYEHNPILMPQGNGFEAGAVYNPTVIMKHDTIFMLYRAQDEVSECSGRIGLAYSLDGINFIRYSQPVIYPEHDYEIYGCEDPRIVKFEDTFYLTYHGKNNEYGQSHICLATSKDLMHWKKHGPVLSTQQGRWDSGQIKAGAIVTEKINGKYVMYFLGEIKPWETAIGIAYSNDLLHWYETEDQPIMLPRENHFDSKGVEPGPPPIVTKDGILMFYNGWNEEKVHKTGKVLFSRKDPQKILNRTAKPILEPTEKWEKFGKVPNVVFSEGLINFNNVWYLYYGAADACICVAISKE